MELTEKITKSNLRLQYSSYSDVYILVKGIVTIVGDQTDGGEVQKAATAATDRKNKSVIFKKCILFTNFVSEINNTQVDNALDLQVVMLMSDLIEYSNVFPKSFIQSFIQLFNRS